MIDTSKEISYIIAKTLTFSVKFESFINVIGEKLELLNQ